MRIEPWQRQARARRLRRCGRIDLKVAAAVALALAGALIAWIAAGRHVGSETASRPLVAPPAASTSAAIRTGEGEGMAPMHDVVGTPTTGPISAMVAAASASPPASSPGTEVPAAWSLADTRVAGDDRAPPIQRSAAEAATPAWQLDDHQAYTRREQDRHQSVQRAFVAAADRELPLLDQQIAQGRAMGVSAEQLAKGEEKRRRIAEMRARMQADLAASAPAP